MGKPRSLEVDEGAILKLLDGMGNPIAPMEIRLMALNFREGPYG
jgi:hypothetical protein